MPLEVQTKSYSATTNIQSGSMPMVFIVPSSIDEFLAYLHGWVE